MYIKKNTLLTDFINIIIKDANLTIKSNITGFTILSCGLKNKKNDNLKLNCPEF